MKMMSCVIPNELNWNSNVANMQQHRINKSFDFAEMNYNDKKNNFKINMTSF